MTNLIQVRARTDINVSSVATRCGASAQDKNTRCASWTRVGSLEKENEKK